MIPVFYFSCRVRRNMEVNRFTAVSASATWQLTDGGPTKTTVAWGAAKRGTLRGPTQWNRSARGQCVVQLFEKQARRESLRETSYEAKRTVNEDAEARCRAPIEGDPEVLSWRSSGVMGQWESRGVCSSVGIASAESHTTCKNAFSIHPD